MQACGTSPTHPPVALAQRGFNRAVACSEREAPKSKKKKKKTFWRGDLAVVGRLAKRWWGSN